MIGFGLRVIAKLLKRTNLNFEEAEYYQQQYNYQKTVTTVFKDEALNYIAEKQKPYKDIEKRATNDFKKRGCYWF